MLTGSPSVCIKDTGTAKGRGVFGLRAFERDEVVEICPVILFARPYVSLPDELKSMVFNWGFLVAGADIHALALGFGSLYNHDSPANLRYEAEASTQLLRFIARRPIDTSEELTINYNAPDGGAVREEHNKWFEHRNIQAILSGDKDA